MSSSYQLLHYKTTPNFTVSYISDITSHHFMAQEFRTGSTGQMPLTHVASAGSCQSPGQHPESSQTIVRLNSHHQPWLGLEEPLPRWFLCQHVWCLCVPCLFSLPEVPHPLGPLPAWRSLGSHTFYFFFLVAQGSKSEHSKTPCEAASLLKLVFSIITATTLY